ncbi:MAG: hypothetical protein FWE28_07645 [Oscillospiraceae bacterium]|nr:hypothetical protein [Oscillospiraceae bacterium]
MASIQCSIELYDGVSPVLQEMAVALENFSGRMVQFSEEMGALSPDAEGIALFGSALGGLVTEAEGAFGVMEALRVAAEGLREIFGQDMFLPLTMGAAVAVEEVGGLFGQLENEVSATMLRMEGQIAAVAAGLPRHFAGPIAEIAGMFQGLAATAQATMNAISASASRALGAVNAVSQASAEVRAVPMSAGGGVSPLAVHGGVVSLSLEPVVSVGPLALDGGFTPVETLAVPEWETFSLPEPQVLLQGGTGAVPPPVTVEVMVQNENHIAAEVDVEAVLQEMEVRLCDAVASSMEGVYG